jgi:hypothetical protein
MYLLSARSVPTGHARSNLETVQQSQVVRLTLANRGVVPRDELSAHEWITDCIIFRLSLDTTRRLTFEADVR